jgi:hypothetical protein
MKRSGKPAGTEALATDAAFGEVVSLIRAARQRAVQAVNTELIDLYWRTGQYVHTRIKADGWAKGTVEQPAAYIARTKPNQRGFSAQNLWSVRRLYEADPALEKLSTALREIHPRAKQSFTDAYLLDFLSLPDTFARQETARLQVARVLCAERSRS